MTAFPPGFVWGAATSAHQIEGGNVGSDWWALEHAGLPFFAEPSGDACDSYHRYREDVDLLAAAGLQSYRFSIEWARIEPAPGEFSLAALGHYQRMIDHCHDRGVEPVVTLHHFTNPSWLRQEGGWTAHSVVDRGTTFTVTMPFGYAHLPADRVASQASAGDFNDSPPTAMIPAIMALQTPSNPVRQPTSSESVYPPYGASPGAEAT